MDRYDRKKFFEAVEYYSDFFKDIKNKNILMLFDAQNRNAFYSIAPLSMALQNSRVNAIGLGKNREAVGALFDVWDTFEDLQGGIATKKTSALKKFISLVAKKIPDFSKTFLAADSIVRAGDFWVCNGRHADFKIDWFKIHRKQELDRTASLLWRDVYNLRKTERVSVGFELLRDEKKLGHPLTDYLDSYHISWHMAQKCPGEISLHASSNKESMLTPLDRVSELRTLLLGCELVKRSKEGIFTCYKKLSRDLKLNRIKPADASFFVSGKGYAGKHTFGEKIGYPSLNGKTRWNSPGQMIYKFDFLPQTKYDDRLPLARVAFTETLPLDIFIDTNLIDWKKLRERNQKVKDVLDKCDIVYVKSNIVERYRTDLEVGLVKQDGSRRWVRKSDTDVREKINKEYLKMKGIKAGNMGNIPGGEAFVTPQYVRGIFVGDVVIAIDQSYGLSAKDPFVVECKGNSYKILSAPKKILKKFNDKKKEAWQLLSENEKAKVLPKEIIGLKKGNFENIGEFAINTNPNAKLCDYLIVNEKIANMMHIALGSGYEEDRSTDYHVDIVFDAPRQKLDVFGKDNKGKLHWILEKGKFAI